MKTIVLFLFIFVAIACKASTVVYVCNNGTTNKYHLKPNCRGLSRCHFKVVKMTLEKAKASQKTLCRHELPKQQKQQAPSKKKHKT
ncbi:hypothetical protein [Pedobacter gandavensis]|uniref:hypothetical protein n=1 Tax=Pedobacter gandavensis TaxID=2679963 RepID=UPI0029314C6C|nr:hypothetical protein [Pedobacter gandavensis]